MNKIKVGSRYQVLGIKIKLKWRNLVKKYNFKIKINGLASLPSFEIEDKEWMYIKTFITQEFLKRIFWPQIQFMFVFFITTIF